MKQVDLTKVKRVLIIRHRAIGDILLVTPFIRALKKALPDAEIDMVIEPMGIEILEGNPYIANKVIFEKNRLKKANLFVKIVDTARFYKGLMDRKYDLVFDLWGNLRTAIMAFITCARYRAGFSFRIRKYLYNIRVDQDIPPKYNAYFHMDLLKAVNIPNDGETLDFYVRDEDNKYADNFMKEIGAQPGGLIIGLNGAGSWITKRWPEHKFAALADMIIREPGNKKVIIAWGPGERHMAEKIYSLIKEDKKDVFLMAPTTLKQLGAMLIKMRVFVSNDGAPNHIAIALDTPTVTVFGPTNYRSWVPAGKPRHLEVHSTVKCAPCDKTSCPTGIECMEGISAEEVFNKMKELLKNTDKM